VKFLKSECDTFISAEAKDFELEVGFRNGWSEVKLWQIAHRIKVGDRLHKSDPTANRGGYSETWIVDRVVKRGVVISLKNGSPHQGTREWLCTVFIEGRARCDWSARSYANAEEWADEIRSRSVKNNKKKTSNGIRNNNRAG
jgi:hypothetical protein